MQPLQHSIHKEIKYFPHCSFTPFPLMTPDTKMLTATEDTEIERDTLIALRSSPEARILSIKVAP